MTQITDYFKPEVLFSRDNPILKSAETVHRLAFDTIDKAARAQLRLADTMLDLNRERFELLYAGKSFTETLDAQQALMAEFGKCAVDYAGDLREAATSMFGRASDAALDAANDLAAKPKASRKKKAA